MTVAVADAPLESVTLTVSVTPPVLPAVYPPADVIEPPELLVDRDQVYPPLPPDAPKLMVLLGRVLVVVGVIDTPAVTLTFRVARLPSESTTSTTSVTPPVDPAV